jgi:hypothetical protein
VYGPCQSDAQIRPQLGGFGLGFLSRVVFRPAIRGRQAATAHVPLVAKLAHFNNVWIAHGFPLLRLYFARCLQAFEQ